MVTQEELKQDVRQLLNLVRSTGKGTLEDRAANMMLYNLELIEQIIGKPKTIRESHSTEFSRLMFTNRVYDVLMSYADGKISEKETREKVSSYRQEYAELFNKMGITPQPIEAVIVMKV